MSFRAPLATSDVPRFPLLWPAEQPRTRSYERASKRWGHGWQIVVNDLRAECASAKIADFALSTGRNNSGSWEDVGAALWFMQRIGDAWAMSYYACDRFKDGPENIKAIAMTLQRLRQVGDYGCYTTERAMRGAAYAALPPPTAAKPKRAWWEVLGVASTTPRVVVDAAYRALANQRHPDKPGGSAEAMAELNEAYQEAKQQAAA